MWYFICMTTSRLMNVLYCYLHSMTFLVCIVQCFHIHVHGIIFYWTSLHINLDPSLSVYNLKQSHFLVVYILLIFCLIHIYSFIFWCLHSVPVWILFISQSKIPPNDYLKFPIPAYPTCTRWTVANKQIQALGYSSIGLKFSILVYFRCMPTLNNIFI